MILVGMLVFGALVLVAVCCDRTPRRPGGALRAVRQVGDIKAAARGGGALTRRYTRRAAFRTVRRW